MKNVVVIEKMDHMGSGIGFIDGKTVFVSKTIPGDKVIFEVIKETKTYIKAKVKKFIERKEDTLSAFCPYYYKCGGCHLQNMEYEKTLEYKKERVKNILNRVGITPVIEVIKNENDKNYRNKIELKVSDGIIGFYEEGTHNIIEIDSCHITKACINTFIEDVKKMNIQNGDVIVRCNYNDELLISIKTEDDIILNKEDYPNKKVAGIILNDKCIYGDNKFIDIINNTFFEVAYDAFFQVNPYINSKLFAIINDNVKGKNVLDLYSGVGTLSIVASKNANKVYGIEVIPSAVVNALKNAKMNKRDNIDFILGKVEDKIHLIKDKIDTVIIDPPRKGLDQKTINKILEIKPESIIYISCETQKLSEDLKSFIDNYNVKKVYILDMFSYTYHCESITVLERR